MGDEGGVNEAGFFFLGVVKLSTLEGDFHKVRALKGWDPGEGRGGGLGRSR